MSDLFWLKLSRRVPGLHKQPEYPNLEALLDAEAEKTADGFHIARWVVPLILSLVGVATFVPLSLAFGSWTFLLGAAALTLLGGALGWAFHLAAQRIPPSRVVLRKRSRLLLSRLVRLRSLLGLEPAISPGVGKVLDDAARLYLGLSGDAMSRGGAGGGLSNDGYERAQAVMESAMAQMLALAEPESASAQEAKLAQGWAMPLLKEMESLSNALARHSLRWELVEGREQNLDALVALREVRVEIERMDEALDELQSGQAR